MRTPRWVSAILIGAAMAFAACGDDDSAPAPAPSPAEDGAVADPKDEDAPAEDAVRAEIQLPGTADDAAVTTAGRSFTLTGTVSPYGAIVRARVRPKGARTAVEQGDTGEFEVEVSRLASGRSRLVLRAYHPGYADWTREIAITRE